MRSDNRHCLEMALQPPLEVLVRNDVAAYPVRDVNCLLICGQQAVKERRRIGLANPRQRDMALLRKQLLYLTKRKHRKGDGRHDADRDEQQYDSPCDLAAEKCSLQLHGS